MVGAMPLKVMGPPWMMVKVPVIVSGRNLEILRLVGGYRSCGRRQTEADAGVQREIYASGLFGVLLRLCGNYNLESGKFRLVGDCARCGEGSRAGGLLVGESAERAICGASCRGRSRSGGPGDC